jgi:hypothetical protein
MINTESAPAVREALEELARYVEEETTISGYYRAAITKDKP